MLSKHVSNNNSTVLAYVNLFESFNNSDGTRTSVQTPERLLIKNKETVSQSNTIKHEGSAKGQMKVFAFIFLCVIIVLFRCKQI